MCFRSLTKFRNAQGLRPEGLEGAWRGAKVNHKISVGALVGTSGCMHWCLLRKREPNRVLIAKPDTVPVVHTRSPELQSILQNSRGPRPFPISVVLEGGGEAKRGAHSMHPPPSQYNPQGTKNVREYLVYPCPKEGKGWHTQRTRRDAGRDNQSSSCASCSA